ncbi:hypothetical protein CWC48_15845 [Pseudomonas sp. S10E 269]|uniref:hypothetical protein n=1 Tax=unclassified Pseudomonas TaxID=196821 RepID=UPI000C26A78B|nr:MULTISPECIES: hypothetical protein [unclassified Pseudomonas]PJK36605.1 hypothetical protein CWC49_25995 [Pseudomonas sp. S09F 262]PJK40551.1 hypothetical protein CWC48_15845 [Pseudomonas sp. S10E 269]
MDISNLQTLNIFHYSTLPQDAGESQRTKHNIEDIHSERNAEDNDSAAASNNRRKGNGNTDSLGRGYLP